MTDRETSRPVEILLVEDNPGDVRLTKEAFQANGIRNTLNAVGDGEQALAYLRRQGKYKNSVRPGLILLDLNLPRVDGREALAEIKSDPELRKIPVIVLTTSRSEEDINKAYDLHANCYITKPVDVHEFINVVKELEHFWLTAVNLPKE